MYKEIACPVCGADEKKVMFPDTLEGRQAKFDYNFSPDHFRTYRIVRCPKCTHTYSSPLPVDLWSNYVSVVDQAYLKNKAIRRATAEKVLKTIRKYQPQGRLLDVGCATGDFLSIAKTYYDIEGLEISSWSAKLAREAGMTIHEKLLGAMHNDGSYDVITLWGVIEHFEKPAQEIRHIFRLLKPGGVVCLWTGDVDCLLSKVLGKKWWYYQGQHIQMFTKKSISRLFADAGFKKEQIGIYPYVMSMESILNSLGRYPAVQGMAKTVVNTVFKPDHKVTIALPGEMFAVFRKPLK